ncbi:MAG: hypothetical protein QOH93_10 [Chloroflexia bacterium]|jgi:hypothetical protein|nr:hypothetical protein [Chloroflexia bacterium]
MSKETKTQRHKERKEHAKGMQGFAVCRGTMHRALVVRPYASSAGPLSHPVILSVAKDQVGS